MWVPVAMPPTALRAGCPAGSAAPGRREGAPIRDSAVVVGSAERREREKQELRTKILDTARELFVTDGYEAVTMRKIAERIEYSPTAIYLHFADKESLLLEVISAGFAALAAQFAKLVKVQDPIERLMKCGRAYVEFGLAHPNHYQLMFSIPAPTGVVA